MIFELAVEYTNRDDKKQVVRAFVEADNLATAAKEGEEAVHNRTKREATARSGRQVDSSLVLIRDGEKPYWLSFDEAKEPVSQGKLGV